MKSKNYKLNIGGTDQRDIELAIQNSLKDQIKSTDINNILGGIQLENIQIPEEFKQQLEQKKKNNNIYTKFDLNIVEDEELLFALTMSITEKFEKKPEFNENTIKINFQFPDGIKTDWIFEKNSQIEDLYDFVQVTKMNSKGDSNYKFILVDDEKASNCYNNLNQTIDKLKLANDCIVYVSKI